MRLGAIVQARMSSSRLPGKVLLPLRGSPLLSYVLERVERADGLDEIVVATSQEPLDDSIEDFCKQRGTACYRGPLDDVAQRSADAAEAHALEAFVRVTGDSPFLDQRLIERGAQVFRGAGADLVSNRNPRRYPVGESVEVVSSAALRRALPGMDAEEREHVTLALYNRAGEFSVVGLDPTEGEDLSGVSLAVDSAADAELADAILAQMDRPHWEYGLHDLLKLRTQAARSRA